MPAVANAAAANHARNRPPIWNGSLVVLLSTLLLSPLTAASLLHVVIAAHALTTVQATTVAAPVSGSEKSTPAAEAAAPRRADDEDDALRRAVSRAAHLRATRLDDEPEPLASSPAPLTLTDAHRLLTHALLIALLAPVAVPASAAPVPLPASTSVSSRALPHRNADVALLRFARSAAPPRAPPVA